MKVVLVTGGRRYTNHDAVNVALLAERPDLIIHGGAEGADSIAQRWAARYGIPQMIAPAKWSLQRSAAGPIRNTWMIDALERFRSFGDTCLVLAFPGGVGTNDCTTKARARRFEIREGV